jgi:hypothetical protein
MATSYMLQQHMADRLRRTYLPRIFPDQVTVTTKDGKEDTTIQAARLWLADDPHNGK